MEEVSEETGLHIPRHRAFKVGNRQLAGTLSAHKADIYAVQLLKEEMDQILEDSKKQIVRGNEKDTERTYVELVTVSQILEESLVDWSNVGMILKTLCK